MLGLQHSNRSAETCADAGDLAGNDPKGNVGVMHTPQSATLAATRHWRRDELDGFEALYGELATKSPSLDDADCD